MVSDRNGADLLTSRDVATRAKVSVQTVTRLRHYGEGPTPIRLGYRTIRYDPADVDAWLAARKGHSTGNRDR